MHDRRWLSCCDALSQEEQRAACHSVAEANVTRACEDGLRDHLEAKDCR